MRAGVLLFYLDRLLGRGEKDLRMLSLWSLDCRSPVGKERATPCFRRGFACFVGHLWGVCGESVEFRGSVNALYIPGKSGEFLAEMWRSYGVEMN